MWRARGRACRPAKDAVEVFNPAYDDVAEEEVVVLDGEGNAVGANATDVLEVNPEDGEVAAAAAEEAEEEVADEEAAAQVDVGDGGIGRS